MEQYYLVAIVDGMGKPKILAEGFTEEYQAQDWVDLNTPLTTQVMIIPYKTYISGNARDLAHHK